LHGLSNFQTDGEDIIEDERSSHQATSRIDSNMEKVTEMLRSDQQFAEKRRTEYELKNCGIYFCHRP
jgi:hypothetical protein